MMTTGGSLKRTNIRYIWVERYQGRTHTNKHTTHSTQNTHRMTSLCRQTEHWQRLFLQNTIANKWTCTLHPQRTFHDSEAPGVVKSKWRMIKRCCWQSFTKAEDRMAVHHRLSEQHACERWALIVPEETHPMRNKSSPWRSDCSCIANPP